MKDQVTQTRAADLVLGQSRGSLSYPDADRSFSPFYSNIGLTFDDNGGIASIALHYNRVTQSLARAVDGPVKGHAQAQASAVQTPGLKVAFFDKDAFVIEGQGDLTLSFLNDPKFRIISDTPGQTRILHVMMPTQDPRDPDVELPLLIGARVLDGAWAGDCVIGAAPRVAITLQLLNINAERAKATLAQAGTLANAVARTEAWLIQACGSMAVSPRSDAEADVLARAVLTLLFNSVEPPGLMAGRIASYPSRGGYPTHFLWDACFHMLALEEMDDRLCRDALLLLTDTIRADGMIAHFICSTWIRPRASQPALTGWAADRYVARTGDLDLARELLPKLEANCTWWLTQRLNRFGLITCFDPFETGWDDTPRLDQGPIVATDMTAYVLMQMRTCARFAELLCDSARAADWTTRADAFAQTLVDVCWNAETGRFHDVLLEGGSHLPILSPAVMLPFLGGVPLPDAVIRKSVETHLLDPARLFGDVPFPCVAYDDPAYDPKQMWRGPMWPPISWLLLELLDQLGMDDIRSATAARLYDILCVDGQLYEYFDSQTGGGLGYPQQGWTAALFLRLHIDLNAV